MPVLLIVFAVIAVVVFVIRLIIGLFTSPVATLAKLGSWVCNLVGLLALLFVGMGITILVSASNSGSDRSEGILVTSVAAVAAILAFGLSGVLSRARRRSELRRAYRDHAAVMREFER